jgi:type IV pilus assembly protein PilC
MAKRNAALTINLDAPKQFRYVAISPNGVRIKGTMRANSAEAVLDTLKSNGQFPLDVREIASQGLNTDVGSLFNRQVKFSLEEKVNFTVRFYNFQKSGTKIPKALLSLGDGLEPRLKDMCVDLSELTASGKSLTEAMSRYPGCFDEVYISYIAAAEKSGQLLETLERLSRMLQRESQVQKNIKAASAYPKIVSIAILVIVTGIIGYLVPKFQTIYASLGSQLPGPTLLLLSISHHIIPILFLHFIGIRWGRIDLFGLHLLPFSLGVHLPMITLGITFPIPPIPFPNVYSPITWLFLIYFAIKYYIRKNGDRPEVGIRLDKIRYGIPVIGKLTRYRDMFRWTSTLAGALQSSITIPDALDLAARTSGSRWQKAIVEDLKSAIRAGRPLSETLDEYPELFPVAVRVMVSTGEGAGNIADLLESSAEAIDSEIELITSTLEARLEVALILTMGIIVGTILIALYLPILSIDSVAAQSLSQGPG